MRITRFLLVAALFGSFLISCSDDDDEQITPNLGISTSQDSFSEGDGTVTLTITTTEMFSNDVTVSYEVSGTATSGQDFEALSGSVTLTAGDTSVTQNLVLIDDDEVEQNETITITLTSVTATTDFMFTTGSVDITITDNDSFAFENGILVLHEGNFFGGNASVSFVSDDLSEVTNTIFNATNGTPLGDTAQSMAFDGDLAYIVVNNSQKVEVVNRYTFESVATISEGFLNPRYIAFANGKGYVTNWGDGTNRDDDYLAVINLETYSVESTIAVPEGPEWIVAQENTLYVAHQGGFNQNNIVSVVDAATNTAATPITVADRPNSMQLVDGTLWVLSGGNPAWTDNETPGQLDKINTTDNSVEASLAFATTEHPNYLSFDNGTLYYLVDGSVFGMDVSDTELPSSAIITDLGFYDMSVNNGRLYGVDAKDFTTAGSLEVYDLSDNSFVQSLEVSIIPGGVYFNGDFEF